MCFVFFCVVFCRMKLFVRVVVMFMMVKVIVVCVCWVEWGGMGGGVGSWEEFGSFVIFRVLVIDRV